MKRLLVFIFILASFSVFSQGGKVEALRAAFIEKKLQLSPGASDKFWPVYNEYNDKIREIRRSLMRSYSRYGENPTEKEAEEIAKAEIKTRLAEYEVHAAYGERIRAILGNSQYIKLRLAEEEFRQKVKDIINPH
jgi:hypothetical protein